MLDFVFSIDAVICRKGRNYPIWVREQGVGRNKSSEVAKKSNRPRSKWKYFAQPTTWPILRWLRLWICYTEEGGISTPPIGPSLHIFPPGNTTLSRHFNVRRKSRFVFTLFLLSAYHELDFSVEDRNTIYWHHTVPKYFPVKPTISPLKLSSGLVLRDQCATLAPLISWQNQPFLK